VERELRNKMNHAEWENDKIVSIRDEEKDKYKEWYGDDQYPIVKSEKLEKIK
jgi:hypothetical protein